MSQYTRAKYDDNRICSDHAANQKYVERTFNPIAHEATTGCLEPSGLPAGSLTSSSILPEHGDRVALEAVLRGQYTNPEQAEYNRDRVNTAIDGFESDLVPPPFCSKDMEPIQTRLGCQADLQYDRLFDIGLVPNHPWERAHGPSVNSRAVARDVYSELNPTDVGSCGGVFRK